MDTFVETIPLRRLPIGKSMVVSVAGKDIALFNVEGNVYATSDACAHAGASLGSSKLQGTIVTCRAHGFRYDITNGNCLNIQGLRVSTYPVRVIDDKIFVAIAEQGPA